MSAESTVRIKTHSDRMVEFTGRLVAQRTSEIIPFVDHQLVIDLQVWALSKGGWAPIIKIRVDDSADPFVESELVDTPVDVENFFFVFEPEAILGGLLPPDLPREDRSEQIAMTFALYENEVNHLLEEFQSMTVTDDQPQQKAV